LAQLQNPSSPRRWQDETLRLASRKCLLKGCDRYFSPDHPLDRYCRDDCKADAASWRIAMANLQYRQSPGGKEKRRERATRHRFRIKAQTATPIATAKVLLLQLP